MPTTAQMRSALLDAYPGEGWRNKVKRMSESQIFVLYTKFKLSGRIK